MISAGVALAIALACTNTVTAQDFTLTVSLPGSPLDGQVVNAAGEAFLLGLTGPASYCPSEVEPNCPAGTTTVFAGLLDLSVEVPGGQLIYVAPDGVIGFTQAHSISYPTGSYFGGFTNTTVTPACSTTSYELINWQLPAGSAAQGSGGILACPDVPSYETGATYQIYALTPDFNETDCIYLDGLLPHYEAGTSFGAWQYT